jgi:hypothetical protein
MMRKTKFQEMGEYLRELSRNQPQVIAEEARAQAKRVMASKSPAPPKGYYTVTNAVSNGQCGARIEEIRRERD